LKLKLLLCVGHLSRRAEIVAKKGRAVAKEAEAEITNEDGLPLQSFVDKMEAGRRKVGKGPVVLPSATDAQKERQADILAVPLRFVSRKSRTALSVPSNFDPAPALARSNTLPRYNLVR
jgi:hypothetical protein